MLWEALAVANVLTAGLLAGEEFVICYGVRRPLAGLEPPASIELRQALIRRLRVLVPAIFGLAFVTGGAAIAWQGGPASVARSAGLVLLLAFAGVTLLGTVPINQAALGWAPAAPPDDWRATVRRWERLDVVRTWLAMGAFALFVVALAVR